MDMQAIEKLIDEISKDPSVLSLSTEVKKIIEGEEPINNLLAFAPIIARIAYGIVEKDGTRGQEIENIVKIIISLLTKQISIVE